MYDTDTFFHLSLYGRVGLVILSTLMAAATLAFHAAMTQHRPLHTRALFAVVMIWLFTWLSPQIYYVYYIFLFETLPWQVVLKSPPALVDIFEFASFSGKFNLSAQTKGGLFWLMILWSSRKHMMSFLGKP